MQPTTLPEEIRNRVLARRDDSLAVLDRIVPSRTALLVIDVQNYFWMQDFPTLYTPQVHDIVGNINAVAQASRQAGVEVIWIKHSFTRGWSTWYNKTTKGEAAEIVVANTAEDSFGFQIHESMGVAPDELQVTKYRYSALLPQSCNLDAILKSKGIDTLIITGGLTNCCCESTARDAMQMDYDVVFVNDANATRSDEQHLATLVSLTQLFADVRSTASTIELLRQSSNGR